MKKLLYIILMLLLASPVFGATYTVCVADEPTCDYGDIGEVNAVDFADGDIIQFNKGETFDDATLTLGAVTNPATKTITLQSYGAGTLPWIKGAGTQGGIYINNNNQDGLSISIKNLNVDGQHFSADWAAIYLYDLHDITIDGVEADGSVDGTYERAAIFIQNATGSIEVKNCTIEHWGPDTLWDTPPTPSGLADHNGLFIHGVNGSGETISIHDNTIQEVEGDGIQLEDVRASGGTIIYNNTLWNGGENNLDIKGCYYVDVYNNTIGRDATFTGTSGSSNGELTQPSVQIIDFNHGYGSNDVEIHDNLIGPDDRVNIRIAVSSGKVNNDINIHHNYFNAAKYHYFTYIGATNLRIHTNIFDGLKANGQFIREQSSKSTLFYNNTFYSADMGPPSESGFVELNTSNSTFKNNIFYVDEDGGSDPIIYVDANSTPTMDYNIYYNAQAGINLWDWKTTDCDTIAEWRSASSQGTNSDEDNPDFTTPGSDFTLQSDSPCIDVGATLGSDYDDGWNPATSLPPVTVDTIDQDMRGDGWEIGAYVYDSDPATGDPLTITYDAGGALTITPDAGGAITITY